MKNHKEIKLKSGLVVPANSECEIKFDGTTVCSVGGGGAGWFKLRCSSLPRYFEQFKAPSMRTLEKWSDECVAKSMLGKRVEPDGYDDQGSPSWMIVIGVI